MDPLPPGSEPLPPPTKQRPSSPDNHRSASPDSYDLPSTSPKPDSDPAYDNCARSDCALAAFQTPETLEVLVHALDQHDFQIALGLRLDPGMRLRVVSTDAMRRRSSSSSSLGLLSQQPTNSDEETDRVQVVEPPTGTIEALDDTETDGEATPTPVNPITVKKKKKKNKKKKKEKEEESGDKVTSVKHDAKDEAEQKEGHLVETGLPGADENIPASPLVISLDSPETPIALLPITPPSEATHFEPDVHNSSERQMAQTSPEEKSIHPVERVPSDPSNKFVSHVLSLAMTLTPPPSPPIEPSHIQLAVKYPAPTDFAPPVEPNLSTPQKSASLLDIIFSGISTSPPVQQEVATDSDSIHLLDKIWTLYFSDTSDKSRQARKISAQAASAEEYSTGLFTIFTASTLEDVLGGWKALRRCVANSKRCWIEPLGAPIQRGTGGLGVSHLGDDNNFHFFLQGISPMWEDPMCSKGGKIMFSGSGSQVSTASLHEPF